MRKHNYLIALLTPLAIVAACGDDAQPSTQGQGTPAGSVEELRASLEGQKVVIGTSGSQNASIVGAYKMVENLDEMFGVDVDFRELDSDPLVAATISGDVQVGQLSTAGVVDANAAGADFVAFGADNVLNTFMIVARSEFDSLEDLRGEPFAADSNPNQITGQTTQVCFEEAGMSVDDVELLQLGNTGEVMSAITAGQVSGGLTAQHRLTPVEVDEGEGNYNVLCKGWEANPQIANVLYANRDWVESNPDMALAINVAQLAGNRWAHDNKDEWVEFATANIEGMTEEVADVSYDELLVEADNWPVDGSLDPELFQNTLDTGVRFGVFEEGQYTTDELAIFDYQERAIELLDE